MGDLDYYKATGKVIIKELLKTLAQVLLAIAVAVFQVAVICLMWQWYLIPLGVVAINFFHALGLSVLLSLFTTHLSRDNSKLWENLTFRFILSMAVLISGSIFHNFI